MFFDFVFFFPLRPSVLSHCSTGLLSLQEIFYRSVEALAESTSAMLAYLHKLSECLLLIGQHRDRFDSGFLDIAEKVAV